MKINVSQNMFLHIFTSQIWRCSSSIILFLSFIPLLYGSDSAETNLIKNPSFEDKYKGSNIPLKWEIIGKGDNIFLSTEKVKNGSVALKFNFSEKQGPNSGILQRLPDISKKDLRDSHLTLSFWIFKPEVDCTGTHVMIREFSKENKAKIITDMPLNCESGLWIRFKKDIFISEESCLKKWDIFFSSKWSQVIEKSAFYIDDLKLEISEKQGIEIKLDQTELYQGDESLKINCVFDKNKLRFSGMKALISFISKKDRKKITLPAMSISPKSQVYCIEANKLACGEYEFWANIIDDKRDIIFSKCEDIRIIPGPFHGIKFQGTRESLNTFK